MTIWSTISSTLHGSPSSASASVPVPRDSPPPLASSSLPPSNDSTGQQQPAFEFYDPRGLGAKVRRSARSRSNTPQTESQPQGQAQGGNSGNSKSDKIPPPPSDSTMMESPGGTFFDRTRRDPSVDCDLEGDVRMRSGSEDPPLPHTTGGVGGGIPIPMSEPASLPASPTPLARSPPALGGGVPLSFGGVQRQPSLKARDAFNRLRIGSFGSTTNAEESNSLGVGGRRTASPTLADEGAQGLNRSPDQYSRRNERNVSAPPTSQPTSSAGIGMGMSPAASFLSSFSPTSAPTTSTYNNNLTSTPAGSTLLDSHGGFSRRMQAGIGGGGGFTLLPPKGDEPGYILPITTSQLFGEGERSSRMSEATAHEEEESGEWVLGKELGSGGMGVVREVVWRPSSQDASSKIPQRLGRRRIAVKIVRKDLLSGGGAGSALEAFGLSPRNAPPTSTENGPQRPLPGSRAASFQLSLPPSARPGTGLRNPSKDRLLGSSFPSNTLERNRSTSSPIKPPSHLFPTSASSSNNGSLSPIEQSPLPSPGLTGGGSYSPSSSSPTLEFDPSPEQTLLDALLNRELALWSHITAPSSSTSPQPHPNIVPLLSTFETSDFSYVFMPLCDGGSLLSYLNSPPLTRDDLPLELIALCPPSERSKSRDASKTTSTSRSRDRSSSSSLRGRNTLPRVKPRSSLPFASSISSSPSTSSRTSRFLSPPPVPQERALDLEHAGKVFQEIVEGLKWLHEEKGVVHKDFKLENLLSCWEEEEEELDDEGGETDRGARSTSRGRSLRSQATRVEGGESVGKRWKRVWKIADFGLSEIIPARATTATANLTKGKKKPPPSPCIAVQPLSTLARGGSLSRPNANHSHSSHLSNSVGPASSPSTATSSSTFHTPSAPSHHSSILVPVPPSTPTSESLTAHLHPIGSLPYSSPESLRSPIPILDPSIDIWALGCVLYAMVEGVLPIWDEWEFRLRTRLLKGDWEMPENLKANVADTERVRKEKELVLEVLHGCLNKSVEARWDIDQVAGSPWLSLVRKREQDEKEAQRRLRRSKLQIKTASEGHWDTEMKDSVNDLPPPSPLRGRPSTARPLLPGLSTFSYSSSAASSTPASTSTSRSTSSSRSLSRSNRGSRPSPVSQDSLPLSSSSHLPAACHTTTTTTTAAAALRRPSRSTSRSSAYSHQGVDSKTQMEELKERGRSQRRLRWEEEKETSRRRRSQSRDALEGATFDETALGLSAVTRGRSSSRSSSLAAAAVSRSRERGGPGSGAGGASSAGGSGERLETVHDEPY